mmetsp:Transcript_6434/g.23873  ORF Transcript_6434/g.23873 Transcript_6434/m.23873 type:complete len:345 (+) Transcript_6434:150-1184(+)
MRMDSAYASALNISRTLLPSAKLYSVGPTICVSSTWKSTITAAPGDVCAVTKRAIAAQMMKGIGHGTCRLSIASNCCCRFPRKAGSADVLAGGTSSARSSGACMEVTARVRFSADLAKRLFTNTTAPIATTTAAKTMSTTTPTRCCLPDDQKLNSCQSSSLPPPARPAALHSPCAAAARAACSRPLRGSSRLLFTSLDTTVATSGATLPQSTEPSESRAKSSSRSSRGPSSPLLPAARGDGAKATSMAARCSATCVTFRRSTVRARQAGWMSCFLESSPNFAALMATTVKRSTSRSVRVIWTVNVSSSGYELVTRKEVSFPRSILANTRACSTSSPSVILVRST